MKLSQNTNRSFQLWVQHHMCAAGGFLAVSSVLLSQVLCLCFFRGQRAGGTEVRTQKTGQCLINLQLSDYFPVSVFPDVFHAFPSYFLFFLLVLFSPSYCLSITLSFISSDLITRKSLKLAIRGFSILTLVNTLGKLTCIFGDFGISARIKNEALRVWTLILWRPICWSNSWTLPHDRAVIMLTCIHQFCPYCD